MVELHTLPGRRTPEVRHFNQIELARRWGLSPRTLERWRYLDEGPEYMKLGNRVLYRLEDIEAFEDTNMQRIMPRTRRAKDRE